MYRNILKSGKSDLWLLNWNFIIYNFFRRCINGVLRKKTRILCTHHPKFLEEATRILVLNEGKIEQVGSPSKILTKLSNLQPFDENLSEDRRTGNGNERRPSITADDEERVKRRRLSSTAGLEEESRESGVVRLHVYKSYWHAVGNLLSLSIIGNC